MHTLKDVVTKHDDDIVTKGLEKLKAGLNEELRNHNENVFEFTRIREALNYYDNMILQREAYLKGIKFSS